MVNLDQVYEARERIGNAIYKSPCARSAFFSQLCDATTYFKLDNLQMTGSFKERGALNKILTLTSAEKERGLVCASAGNHAQAVAYHSQRLGLEATIVMPARTPLIKVANTRSYGANVILQGDSFDEALARAFALQRDHGFNFIHPFEDEMIIAGQGTMALELIDQQPSLDIVICPIGGGGLISGVGLVYKALKPDVRIIGVEAEVIPSMSASRNAGAVQDLEAAQTIADGIAVKKPGALTFSHVEKYVDDIVTVSEEEIANAIMLLLEREKTVVEGAAAATLAALANGRIADTHGKNVCMLLCGGNIDVNLISRIIDQGLTKDGRLFSCVVSMADRPGSLASLLGSIAEAEANVIEVHHQRTFNVGLGEVDIALTLETRGFEHVDSLISMLEERGFEMKRVEDRTGSSPVAGP